MKAPIGSMVKFSYEAPDIEVTEGNILKTTSGRLYLVVSVRKQVKGFHAGLWHLVAIVIAREVHGAQIHPLYWKRR